jgi:hypothetical protein
MRFSVHHYTALAIRSKTVTSMVNAASVTKLAVEGPQRASPDGQITASADLGGVESCLQKFSVSFLTQIKTISLASRPTEGRLAIVTDAGRDAVDAVALVTNSAKADGEVVWS